MTPATSTPARAVVQPHPAGNLIVNRMRPWRRLHKLRQPEGAGSESHRTQPEGDQFIEKNAIAKTRQFGWQSIVTALPRASAKCRRAWGFTAKPSARQSSRSRLHRRHAREGARGIPLSKRERRTKVSGGLLPIRVRKKELLESPYRFNTSAHTHPVAAGPKLTEPPTISEKGGSISATVRVKFRRPLIA